VGRDGPDQRVKELGNAGATSKSQLMVLTALLLADEVFDLRDNVANVANNNEQLKRDVNDLLNQPQQVVNAGFSPQDEAEIGNAIGKLASRVDQLVKRVQKA
jgi:cell division protein ZapA (FtsZ GTPase activity inhibitor)